MKWRARDCSGHIRSKDFPNLWPEDFKCQSDPETDYNCIAWAARRTDKKWWPTTTKPYFWPPGLPKKPVHIAENPTNFIRAFQREGYRPCRSDRFSWWHEKVVIYVGNDGRVKHMARRLSDGTWTSKLGIAEDIDHRNLGCIAGGLYGTVKVVLKRKWPEDDKPKLRKFLWFHLKFSKKTPRGFSPIPKLNPTDS
jgi:hypothetical protein